MKMQVFILIVVALLGILLSLGGCIYHTPTAPLFYQVHDPSSIEAPSPFFLTIEEAQAFASKMNKESENNYQVSFIAR